jgi:hypothetical protein
MPDLTGLPALDVAIGLAFIFLLLSLVASTLQELLANVLSLRANVLERGLRNMLADDTPAPAGSVAATTATSGPRHDLLFRVYAHPMIRSLYRESWFPIGRKTIEPAKDTEQPAAGAGAAAEAHADATHNGLALSKIKGVRLPSYIAPRSFALALLDTIAPNVPVTDPQTGQPVPDQDVIRRTREAIVALNIPGGVKHRLLALLDDARGDIEAFRRNVEAWFDDTMARVSGWYKRRAQLIILVLAVVITAALNANTLTMGERLWRDPTLRATLVQQAGSATSAPKDNSDAQRKLEDAVDNVESVAKAGVPLGWAQAATSKEDPRHIRFDSPGGWVHWLGGWLLTILAISLGAPFWFDTLSRLSRLRGTGKPETPLPATGRGQPNERVVTGTAPVNVTVQHVPAIAAASVPPQAAGGGQAELPL